MEQTNTFSQRNFGISLFALKLIAMGTMVCDHVGALFFPTQDACIILVGLPFPFTAF